ncbi:hypothetical protein FRB90_008301 [Tulasnella sp. 427]|nr:hypothetical protein FRB90_008301 [Tulasnella sp. 427]
MDQYSQYYDPYETEALPARWRWKVSSSGSYASSEVPQTDPTPPRDIGPSTSADRPSQTSSSSVPSGPRRSTRQPGLTKNPYIAREANNLKAARNRIYALIDASEEAQKAADTSKSLREAVATGETVLSSAVLTQRLLAGRSRSATPARGPGRPPKRRRGVMEAEERYEHAYGYGDKDGDDVEMEKELQKEYDEIVGKLWVEGPATTGAVITYLKARRRLLQVVDLVRQWEAYKAEHNIPETEGTPTASKAVRPKPTQADNPARRSLRARLPATRTLPQSDTEGPPRRKHRKKEHPSASGVYGSTNTPTRRSGLSYSFSMATVDDGKPNSTRSASSSGSNSSLSPLSSSESRDGRVSPMETSILGTGIVHADPEEAPSDPYKRRLRRTARLIKTADNSPLPEVKALPDEAPGPVPPLKATRSLILRTSSLQRSSSHPAPGASDAPEGTRLLRSRSKLNLPSKFDGFVSTTLQT